MSFNSENLAERIRDGLANPKKLFAIAVEKGSCRIPDLIYTHAKCREDVLSGLVGLTSPLPKRTRVVNVAECVGYLSDDKGRIIV
jgi:hypothetical protein